MNDTELARDMLAWQEAQEAADAIGARIIAELLARGNSLKVGNVVASYRKGTVTRDYERGFMDALQKASYDPAQEVILRIIIDDHKKEVIDWKAACEAAQIVAPENPPGKPSVSLKIVKK